MRVLVLGGSVFLGRAVVEEALARGDDVTTFTRGRTGSIPAGAHSVVGDRAADNGLRGLGDGSWDVVVDVTRSPTQISRAIAQLGDRIGHYVFISTVSVYASFAEGPLDEGSPVSPASGPADDEADPAHYGPLKVHCEELVRGAFGDHALVIRPGLIVGPGDPSDRFTYWVERGTRGGSVLAPGDPNTPARYLDVRDLATWIRLAAANNLTGTFNAVGPGRPTSMGEVIERCIDIGGGGAAPVWVTDAFLDEQDVAAYSELPLWVPDGPTYRYFSHVSAARAVEAGMVFRPLTETVIDTLAWTLGRTDAARSGGLSVEREAALLAAWASRDQ